MNTKLFAALLAATVTTTSFTYVQTATASTQQTTGDQEQVGAQAANDTKSGKKARKAEKKMAKGKEHKAMKKQVKADDKENVGR